MWDITKVYVYNAMFMIDTMLCRKSLEFISLA